MKKGKILGLLAMSAVLLTGCADAMPEMTDEQSDMIAEYAADLLLKYSPNYNYKIAGEQELAEAIELERVAQESTELEESTIPEEEDSTSESVGQSPEETESAVEETQTNEVELVNDIDADIAELLAIDEVVIRYQSFELCESYPKGSAGFSVTAAQGKTLLIMRFDVESATGGTVDCNLFDYNLKISMGVNGRSAQALSTLLPDDITSYMDTIPEGSVQELVAVAEIDEITEEEIETLSLQISNGADRCVLQIR